MSKEPTAEPDWKALAESLALDLEFALLNLKAKGSPILFNSTTGQSRHWKTRFADSIDKIPGVKVDRELMFAVDQPKRELEKFLKERKKAS